MLLGRRIRALHQGPEQGHPLEAHRQPPQPEDQTQGSLQARPPTNKNRLIEVTQKMQTFSNYRLIAKSINDMKKSLATLSSDHFS